MSLIFAAAPNDVRPSDVIVMCEHEPREHWTRVTGRAVGRLTSTGEHAAVDWVALCDDCQRRSGVCSLRLSFAHRLAEGGAA